MEKQVESAPPVEQVFQKLNPEAKAAYLDVLRDPNIIQIKDWLFNGRNGFCAVGALAEAYRRTMNDGEWIYVTGQSAPGEKSAPGYWRAEHWRFASPKTDEVAHTNAILKWAGINGKKINLFYDGNWISLVTLNRMVDFKTLADLIEKNM